MQGIHVAGDTPPTSITAKTTAYVWGISLIAALGGLLFGYDWVVIGGARQFYEVYFRLTSAALVGWANSCALVGCLIGSLAAGYFADRYGRRPVLLIAAVLFTVSSIFTGWAWSFSVFIFCRIAGGIAIGLASNVSPLYIAEISPAAMRGRLVSLNQFAIVVGILLAQIANWRIARPVPSTLTPDLIWHSWNVQYGWRWMFTAVALPAVIFIFTSLFIPESPRWLLTRAASQRPRMCCAGSVAMLMPIKKSPVLSRRLPQRLQWSAPHGASYCVPRSAVLCWLASHSLCCSSGPASIRSSTMRPRSIAARVTARTTFFSISSLLAPST